MLAGIYSIAVSDFKETKNVIFCLQALPFVGLLILLLFFIYAVIGMQVILNISILNN